MAPALVLQRTVGNQGVQRLLRAGVIQAKLRISRPADSYEREADRVADQVMRMPAPGAEERGTACAACAGGASPCPKCAGRQSLGIQRYARRDDASVSDSFVNKLSPGRPLDAATRGFFESRFSQDFGQVRIHTDSGAAESARMLDAKAYTAGPNVVFAAGEYAPHTGAGRRLLAHELTHVVQQQATGPRLDRYTETTEANSRFWQGAAELVEGPLVRWTRGYFCLEQVFPPMHDLTFNHWIPDTCTARGGAGALHARDWDAFGHCWVACEGSRRCGNAATRDLGFLRTPPIAAEVSISRLRRERASTAVTPEEGKAQRTACDLHEGRYATTPSEKNPAVIPMTRFEDRSHTRRDAVGNFSQEPS